MAKKPVILGLDTSNYKTSVALCDLNGRIIGDERKLLEVARGERGLRQSVALFQHVMNLPGLMENLMASPDGAPLTDQYEIVAVCASSRPRPVEGSYMPCFNAGLSTGHSIASSKGIPFYETSHQEGHLEAIKGCSKAEDFPVNYLALHLSGGTCELLKVSEDAIEIVGGSKDISFGQVLDRLGVAMGLEFPSGAFMDDMALEAMSMPPHKFLSKIRVTDSYFNLSGLETQSGLWLKKIDEQSSEDALGHSRIELVRDVFDKISDTIWEMLSQKLKETGLNTAMFVGGVSSSKYISQNLIERANKAGYYFEFGDQRYSSDNATGVARIGLKAYLSNK